jgi:CheY-like chemotaxis protein
VARILVIDEDTLLRANLRRLLVLEGHEVVEASGGCEGVELALVDPPDAVLCDLVMPDLGGVAVRERLRADPRTARVPFVLVTGSVTPALDGYMPPFDADGYVTKPFELEGLLGVLARVLAGASRG